MSLPSARATSPAPTPSQHGSGSGAPGKGKEQHSGRGQHPSGGDPRYGDLTQSGGNEQEGDIEAAQLLLISGGHPAAEDHKGPGKKPGAARCQHGHCHCHEQAVGVTAQGEGRSHPSHQHAAPCQHSRRLGNAFPQAAAGEGPPHPAQQQDGGGIFHGTARRREPEVSEQRPEQRRQEQSLRHRGSQRHPEWSNPAQDMRSGKDSASGGSCCHFQCAPVLSGGLPEPVPDGKPGIIGSVLHTLSPVSVHNLSVSGQKFPGIRAGLSIYSILQPDYNFLYSAKAVRTRCRNPVCPRENEWFFLTNIPLRDSIISKYLFVRFLQAACQ